MRACRGPGNSLVLMRSPRHDLNKKTKSLTASGLLVLRRGAAMTLRGIGGRQRLMFNRGGASASRLRHAAAHEVHMLATGQIWDLLHAKFSYSASF